MPGNATRRRKQSSGSLPPELSQTKVQSLDLDGRGVARHDGKVVFIDGALPGETVQYRVWRRNPRFDLGSVQRIVRATTQRVVPQCPHYECCGGCSLQHLEPRAQVAMKQRVLEEAFANIGHVQPESMLPAIHGSYWGYRHRARLSARHVAGKGGTLVGFRERRGHRVVDMDSCKVLPPRISALIAPLRLALSGLQIADRIPQIEVAVGEEMDVLTLRVLDAPAEADLDVLRAFAASYSVLIYLQTGGPDTVHALDPASSQLLSYRLPEFDLDLQFGPSDFTQVNPGINRMLVRRAVALLEPQPHERIVDLFCGLGNFALAIARSGATVVGMEGGRPLVERAQQNAQHNGLDQHTRFVQANLFENPAAVLQSWGPFDRMLIDPPRDGAQAVVKAIGEQGPTRIVYISCNPATLARDAGCLVHEKGYRLLSAGVANMFPHTSHVESMAAFVRG